MACKTFTDLTYVSVFSWGRTTTYFFHTTLKRSSISVLASFISYFSAMTVSAQIPERETATTLPALSVPPIETVLKWKKGFFAPRLVKFSSKRWMANFLWGCISSIIFCAILRRSVSTHRVIMRVASGQTQRKSSMLTSDVLGNFFFEMARWVQFFLPFSGSQVSGRKSVVSFDTYNGSHETVSDDC